MILIVFASSAPPVAHAALLDEAIDLVQCRAWRSHHIAATTRAVSEPSSASSRYARSRSGSTQASCQPVMPRACSSCWARSRYVFQWATVGCAATVRSTS